MEHSLDVSRRLLEDSVILDELMAEVRALRRAVRAAEAMPSKPGVITAEVVSRSSPATMRPNDRAA